MRRAAPLVLVVGLAMIAACSSGGDEAQQHLDVFVPYRGVEIDRFSASMEDFERATGVELRIVGSSSYAEELQRRVNDAQPPDVALVPQPGLVAELVETDVVRPLGDAVVAAMDEHVVDGVRGAVELAAVPYRASVKSLVWYSPAQFSAEGWAIPATLAELAALTERIARDEAASGVAPWCVGINALGDTGWVMTDWVEDHLLRLGGPGVYDRWVRGTVRFQDPEVVEAFEAVESLLLVRGHAVGNAGGMLRTRVEDAIAPLLEEPPGCALHRNASFTQSWLPEGTEIGPEGDLDVFVLPPADAGTDPPLLAGIDLAVALTDAPAAQELLAHLATPDATEAWTDAGGFVAVHDDVDRYPRGLDRRVARLLAEAPVVAVDGSDQMEPAFGEGAFWELVSQWTGGARTTEDVVADLDRARDELRE